MFVLHLQLHQLVLTYYQPKRDRRDAEQHLGQAPAWAMALPSILTSNCLDDREGECEPIGYDLELIASIKA